MKIKTAIIGYGRNGSTMHAGAIEKNPNFEMTAVCDLDPEALEKAKARFQCDVWDNYKDMIEKQDFDLIVIVTRSSQHCRMACDCLTQGHSVLVTKPWAIHAGEASRMIETAQQFEKKCLAWLPALRGSVYTRLCELNLENRIGKLFMIKHTVSSYSMRNDWQTLKEYGGGYLLNWGPHVVQPPVLLSKGKPVSVFGKLKQVINPGNAEDVFTAQITTNNGVIIQAEFLQCAKGLPDWTIMGERGTVFVSGTKFKIHTFDTDHVPDDQTYGSQPKETVEQEEVSSDLYGDVDAIYEEIASCIRDDEPYGVTPQMALDLSIWLDAIRKSSETNRVVNL